MFSRHLRSSTLLLVTLAIANAGTSVAQDTKTLTIKGSNADSGDTIEIPSSAEVSVVVGESGIVLTMPQLDVRLRCLGEATANGYCYIAAGSGSGGALVDGDGDNVPDSWDTCPNTPSSATVINTSGCADIDGDGYYENNDDCPNQGGNVDTTGCPASTGGASYTVTASAGAGGTISPSGAVTVSSGATQAFEISPSSGYQINDVTGTCPTGSLVGSTYTTGAVTADCTVVANFSPLTDSTSYCSNIPTALQDTVICSPNASGLFGSPGGNMDNWSQYTGYIAEAQIPARKIVAYPFTANAAGQTGRIEFTTNSGRVRDNMTFKAWFSETPGGAVLDTAGGCSKTVVEPNPLYLGWQQNNGDSSLFTCGLGAAERTLYMNVELACHIASFDCGFSDRYPYTYYVEIANGR